MGLSSLLRRWKRQGMSCSDMVKMQLLLLGMYEYMDGYRVYRRRCFNRIRRECGYRYAGDLIDAVRRSGAFCLIERESDGEVEAFFSPLACSDVEVPEGCRLTEAEVCLDSMDGDDAGNGRCGGGSHAVASCDCKIYAAKAAGKRAREKRACAHEATRLPGPSESRTERAERYVEYLRENAAVREKWIDGRVRTRCAPLGLTEEQVGAVVERLIRDKLMRHIASRYGVEAFSDRAITAWMRNYLGTKAGDMRIDECVEEWRESERRRIDDEVRDMRSYRPVSPHEWMDRQTGRRYYYDIYDCQDYERPQGVEPRPDGEVTLNVVSREWM